MITRVTNPVMSRLLVLPNIRGVFLTLYPAARKKEGTSLKGEKRGKRGKMGKISGFRVGKLVIAYSPNRAKYAE